MLDKTLTGEDTISYCSACALPIRWLKHAGTGKVAPINANARMGGGNILVDLEERTYRVVKHGEGTHTNHFFDCPDAKEFGKGRG